MMNSGDYMLAKIYLYCYSDETPLYFDQALAHFLAQTNQESVPVLLRNKQNKPYFENNACYLSKSHTRKDHFVAFSTVPVSIDFQDVRQNDTDKIVKRFFTRDEQRWLTGQDPLAFYSMWCAKEAIVKYYSQNIEDVIDTFSTVSLLENQAQSLSLKSYRYTEQCYGAILSSNPFTLSAYVIDENVIIKEVKIKELDYALR